MHPPLRESVSVLHNQMKTLYLSMESLILPNNLETSFGQLCFEGHQSVKNHTGLVHNTYLRLEANQGAHRSRQATLKAAFQKPKTTQETGKSHPAPGTEPAPVQALAKALIGTASISCSTHKFSCLTLGKAVIPSMPRFSLKQQQCLLALL